MSQSLLATIDALGYKHPSRFAAWLYKRKMINQARRDGMGAIGPVLGFIYSGSQTTANWFEDYAQWPALAIVVVAVAAWLYSSSWILGGSLLLVAVAVAISKTLYPEVHLNGGGARWIQKVYEPGRQRFALTTMPAFASERVATVLEKAPGAKLIINEFDEDPIVEIELNGERVVLLVYDENGNEVVL